MAAAVPAGAGLDREAARTLGGASSRRADPWLCLLQHVARPPARPRPWRPSGPSWRKPLSTSSMGHRDPLPTRSADRGGPRHPGSLETGPQARPRPREAGELRGGGDHLGFVGGYKQEQLFQLQSSRRSQATFSFTLTGSASGQPPPLLGEGEPQGQGPAAFRRRHGPGAPCSAPGRTVGSPRQQQNRTSPS